MGGEKEVSRFLTLNPHRIPTVLFPADSLMASLEIYIQGLCHTAGEQVGGSRAVPLGQGRTQLTTELDDWMDAIPTSISCVLWARGAHPRRELPQLSVSLPLYPQTPSSPESHTYVPATWIIWNTSADVSHFSDSLSSFQDVQNINTCVPITIWRMMKKLCNHFDQIHPPTNCHSLGDRPVIH